MTGIRNLNLRFSWIAIAAAALAKGVKGGGRGVGVSLFIHMEDGSEVKPLFVLVILERGERPIMPFHSIFLEKNAGMRR